MSTTLHSLKAWKCCLLEQPNLWLCYSDFCFLWFYSVSPLQLSFWILVHMYTQHFPKCELWGELRTKQCSTGVKCFISAGCPRAFIMYNAVSLQEETLTCSIFSKFILQCNSSYPGGPSGLQNTLLEMLLNRLGGRELASLLEKKCLRDCIPNNLPLSLWVWDLALCATVQQSFHLDTPLLEIQNTEKLHRTENNSVRMHLGQILDQKIQKDKKEKSPWHPSLKSHEPWVSGAKACTQYHRVGAGRHLSHPSSLTSGHTPALSSNKEWAHSLSRSKQEGSLFSFSPAAGRRTLIELCLNFLSGL